MLLTCQLFEYAQVRNRKSPLLNNFNLSNKKIIKTIRSQDSNYAYDYNSESA